MNDARTVLSILALVSLSFSVDVGNCSILDTAGETYTLVNNLLGAPHPGSPFPGAACIKITAPVTLDCNGFNITNNGTAGTTAGILLSNVTNATVKNCPQISKYAYGVYLDSSNLNLLANITSYNDTGSGFSISGYNNTLIGNTADRISGFIGFLLSGSNHTLINNTAANTGAGFAGASSSGHTLMNNLAYNLSFNAFILGSDNTLINNTALNNSGFSLSGSNNVLINNSGGAFSFLYGSSNNRLTGNTGYSFILESSSNNKLINNSAIGPNPSGGYGFWLISGNYNILTGNTARNNLVGFLLRDGIGNIITNNSAFNNSQGGLLFSSGTFNGAVKNTQLFCNTFCSNTPDINQANGLNNSGDDNKCGTAMNWNDNGAVGCTFSCDATPICEQDADFDRVLDDFDNCPADFNPGQEDLDDDGVGDACDDSDGDGVVDAADKCVMVPGPSQGCPPCPPPLTTPGETYVLTHNLVGAPNNAPEVGAKACIKIAAPGVTLDCNGFSIQNNGIFIDNGTIIGGGFDSGTTGVLTNGSLTGITIENCTLSQFGSGILLYKTNDSIVKNNHAFNNLVGVSVQQSNGNTVTGNSGDGVSIGSSSRNIISGNSGRGVSLFQSNTNTVSGNSGGSFSLGSSSHNNTLANNLGGSFSVIGCSNNSFTNNTASNSFEGFNVGEGSNNTFINNSASGIKRGFRIGPTAVRDVFIGNNVSNNTFEGFEIFGGFNNFTNNTVSYNGMSGFKLSSGAFDVFAGNIVFRNSPGFFISGTSAIRLLNNEIFNNSGSGVQIGSSGSCCSLNTSLNGDHLYGNHPDVHVEIAVFSPGIPGITLSEVIFDNPMGNLANYTTLSLSDLLSAEPQAVYDISWSAEPAAPPVGFRSYAGKYVSISPNSPLTTIDNATWHWLDSEQGDEASFKLWKNNGTWTDMNATLDTAANTLFISNLTPLSVFGILQDNPDDDFDGVCDPGETSFLCTGSDQCPGSVPDPVDELNPRHYAQTIGFAEFEVGPDNDESIVYDQNATYGCTCSQILDALGSGQGGKKNGCAREIMEQWTGVSAQPDWDAGVGSN